MVWSGVGLVKHEKAILVESMEVGLGNFMMFDGMILWLCNYWEILGSSLKK